MVEGATRRAGAEPSLALVLLDCGSADALAGGLAGSLGAPVAGGASGSAARTVLGLAEAAAGTGTGPFVALDDESRAATTTPPTATPRP
ncbi:MAG TPA: hypothetical protein VFZ53_33065, partial [Polyangiaceae bacterium]